jgi:hypothetical protein
MRELRLAEQEVPGVFEAILAQVATLDWFILLNRGFVPEDEQSLIGIDLFATASTLVAWNVAERVCTLAGHSG